MESDFGILDTIKKSTFEREFDLKFAGYTKYYEQLPKGIKSITFSRYLLFIKSWNVIIAGKFHSEIFDSICKEKEYSLITEKVKKPETPEMLKGAAVIYETNDLARKYGGLYEPDMKYYVNNGKKLLLTISWYYHKDSTLFEEEVDFEAYNKIGLSLIEDYRTYFH